MLPPFCDVITCGDLIPVLRQRYGINLTEQEKCFIQDLEVEFLNLIMSIAYDSSKVKLLDQDFFCCCLKNISPEDTIILSIDDLYIDKFYPPFYQFSYNRVFESKTLQHKRLTRRVCEMDGSREVYEFEIFFLVNENLRSQEVCIFDDGIFSGGTIYNVVERLIKVNVQVNKVYTIIGKMKAVLNLQQKFGVKIPIIILGCYYTGGWDHCRDLIGLHGLKIGTRGYVPYWNIPHWISLTQFKSDELAFICKKFFGRIEEFLASNKGIVFKRIGIHLIPEKMS